MSRHFFIIPTDTHNYKIIGMLKTIKIPTIAPTCFSSRRNHNQGAISCLVKITIMILSCSSLMTWSMLWRHTSLLCKRAIHGTGRHLSAFLYRVSHAFIIVCISWNNKINCFDTIDSRCKHEDYTKMCLTINSYRFSVHHKQADSYKLGKRINVGYYGPNSYCHQNSVSVCVPFILKHTVMFLETRKLTDVLFLLM